MTVKRTVIIASVHHTGTHFVTDQIVGDFKAWHFDHNGKIAGPLAPKIQVRVHIEPRFMGVLKHWTAVYKALVPLRHPMSVAVSWKSRGKDLKILAEQFRILKEKVDPNDPFYLPIDVPEREQWLDAIREYLGESIQTEWPVIKSVKKTAVLTDSEQDFMRDIMSDGFFAKFGYGVP